MVLCLGVYRHRGCLCLRAGEGRKGESFGRGKDRGKKGDWPDRRSGPESPRGKKNHEAAGLMVYNSRAKHVRRSAASQAEQRKTREMKTE